MELRRVPVVTVSSGRAAPTESLLPVEVPVTVYLNEHMLSTLMALPGQERELAIGYCLGTGVVASFRDIYLVQHCPDEDPEATRRVVRVQARPEAVRFQAAEQRLVLAGCGGLDLASWGNFPRLPEPSGVLVKAEQLYGMALRLRRESPLYRKAGAVHVAALFGPDGTLRAWAEDIGRHNAADKAVGGALLRGEALDDAILLTTGRASHELVVKARHLSIPCVGVLSAPTSLAVQLAVEGRCTLVGRFRASQFLIYAWPERIG
ncbi:MAG: formate dehydrogenase accessory sulfurtransferase FdhD [Chloroflexia bacterium]